MDDQQDNLHEPLNLTRDEAQQMVWRAVTDLIYFIWRDGYCVDDVEFTNEHISLNLNNDQQGRGFSLTVSKADACEELEL